MLITIAQLKKENKYLTFTEDEKQWLQDLADRSGILMGYSKRETNYRRTCVYCAIYALCENRDCRVLASDPWNGCFMTKEECENPDNLSRWTIDSHSKFFITNLSSYACIRWQISVSKKLVIEVIKDLIKQREFIYFDHQWERIKLIAKKIQNNEVKPLPFDEVYQDLSIGIKQEPYRKKVIQYLFEAPLKLRLREYEFGDPILQRQNYQAIPVIVTDDLFDAIDLIRSLSSDWYIHNRPINQNNQLDVWLRAAYWIDFHLPIKWSNKATVKKIERIISTPYSRNASQIINHAMMLWATEDEQLLKNMPAECPLWPIKIIEYDREKFNSDYFVRAYATELLHLRQLIEQTPEAKIMKLLDLSLPETLKDRTYKMEHFQA